MNAPTFAELAGVSAWIAAAATVVGMAALLAFFRRGNPWGTYNDAASVVLMLAMVPVAIVLAAISAEVVTTIALVVGLVGVGAMVVLALLQALLVIGRVRYEQTKAAVLGLGAVVGLWYLLVAYTTMGTAVPGGARIAAAVAGLGYMAVGYGFAVGGERHVLSVVGGLTLFVASLVFLGWIGIVLLDGSLLVPVWNA